ncbi:hypothetical protein AVEN_134895-1 [Araneus ventricosus]|uniref:Uncharacterized protein n=1 Tax=Araneus ventricosus TaxID=182803 RepID=A0A4Y2CGX7_ARAVE|nr:hypothetical protein AVEN_134895-1 [Araneus ventricosus]
MAKCCVCSSEITATLEALEKTNIISGALFSPCRSKLLPSFIGIILFRRKEMTIEGGRKEEKFAGMKNGHQRCVWLFGRRLSSEGLPIFYEMKSHKASVLRRVVTKDRLSIMKKEQHPDPDR